VVCEVKSVIDATELHGDPGSGIEEQQLARDTLGVVWFACGCGLSAQ